MFWEGVENGAFSGAITGAVFGGIGGAGALFGKTLTCGTKIANFISTTAKVSGGISLGMDGFDVVALGMGMIDPENPLTALNDKLHSSNLYNAFQIGVNAVATFTGAASATMACFIAGTMVLTATGLVAIEKIKAGDVVISTDPDTLETAEKPVLETYVRQVDTLVHLTINGEEIVTTDNHPFYVQGRGFIEADKLLVGDKLISVNGEDLVIEEFFIEETAEPVDVYNFQVEDYHTYFVGDCAVWVHNAECIVHPDGEIEITDWRGYPENGPKPSGKLKLLEGDDYQKALKAKNAANRKYHRQHPECKGMDIHEVHPVKFSGSPTDVSNKIPLSPSKHQEYTSFWATIQSIASKK